MEHRTDNVIIFIGVRYISLDGNMIRDILYIVHSIDYGVATNYSGISRGG